MIYLNYKFIYGNSRVKLHTGDILFCGDDFLFSDSVYRLYNIGETQVTAISLRDKMRKNKTSSKLINRDILERFGKKTKRPMGQN